MLPGLYRLTIAVVLAVSAILAPSLAQAQAVTSSFEELRRALKNGQTVVVTETSGHRTKGKVSDVTTLSPSIVLLTPEPRSFSEPRIAQIRATDSVLNGALIGANVGFGLALWDYAIDPSEPGNGIIFSVSIGLGTAIGAGIDALIKGKLLYRSPQQKRSVTISPITTGGRRGLRLAVRF